MCAWGRESVCEVWGSVSPGGEWGGCALVES